MPHPVHTAYHVRLIMQSYSYWRGTLWFDLVNSMGSMRMQWVVPVGDAAAFVAMRIG